MWFYINQKVSNIKNQDKIILKNLGSKVEYKNIQEGVNLNYSIKSNTIKEAIILDKPSSNSQFNFSFKVKNLIAKLNDDNSIYFLDSKDTSKVIFNIQSPFMYDSKNEVSTDIKVEFIKKDNEYTLTLIPNKEWLNDKSRLYPITIDPSIETSKDINKIHDSYVPEHISEKDKKNNKTYGGVEFLQVGKAPATRRNRAYISFDIPKIDSSNIITKANLYLWLYEEQKTPVQIDAHKVEKPWDSKTIVWENQPATNTKIEDYAIVSGKAGGSPFKWDVTSIAKECTSTGKNYGVMLKGHNETEPYSTFISSDCESGLTEGRPREVIYYTNASGLENYWTYNTQDVDRAGTGYVNDYNGNLVFVHDDLSMNGNRMPISLNHVFNSNEKLSSIGYGNGWRLNLSQRIVLEKQGNENNYIYTDEDGTKHCLKYDDKLKVYKDDTGIDITLTMDWANVNETYRIKDKKSNQLLFTKWGYLYKIKDSNNNVLTLGYNGATLKRVSDGSGRVTLLDVNQYGYLVGIIDPSNRRTSFAYNGANLTKITYSDGKYSEYSYDGSNNLIEAKNYDGHKIKYTYYGASPYRISSISDINTSGNLSEKLTVNYGFNTTTYTDSRQKKNIYQFNNVGNTVSIRDDNGNALYYNYDNKSSGKKEADNKLSLESKLQKPSVNYLKNHSGEFDLYWSTGYFNGATGSADYSSEEKYLGNRSLKIQKNNDLSRYYFGQAITLEKGKTYTLSSYVKTDGITSKNGKGATVFINYTDKNGVLQSIDSDYINGTNDWQREEVTFTLPKDASSNVVYARVGIVEEQGKVYFDCMQLEDGEASNRYNIVENSNLEYGNNAPEFWSKNEQCISGYDELIQLPDSLKYIKQNKNEHAFKIYGGASKNKSIYQKINLKGKAGDVFVLGGWAKAESIPLSKDKGKRYFALDLGIEKTDGSYEWRVVPFNEDSTEWQYVSSKIKVKADYKSVTFYTIYYGNENIAYFDRMQLHKEEFGESYVYDKDGNLVSSQDLAAKNSKFEYSNNDLVKSISPKGNKFTYKYDGKHNITEATSAENIKYSFSYDKNGNPLTAKIGETNGLTLESKAEYTEDGNYIKSIEDSSGNKVSYDYDKNKGILNKTTDAKGNSIYYSYDSMDRLTKASTASDKVSNSYTYENDKIKSIGHNGFNYNFEYDAEGNTHKVNVGNQNLITNEYDEKTNNLVSSNYGNGQTTKYKYDDEDRLTEYLYKDKSLQRYIYDGEGKLATLYDNINDIKYKYDYDVAGRLNRIKDSKGNITSYNYDADSNLSSFQEKINGMGYKTSYEYDKDNKVTSIYYNALQTFSGMEFFPLNTSTIGSKGTKPYVENDVKFEKDIDRTVLTTTNTTKLLYDLGIKQNQGTIGTWFNSKVTTGSRYIIASETKDAILDMYIDDDNKLTIAVRNKEGKWQVVAQSKQLQVSTWYYGAVSWKVEGNKLNVQLYLNDEVYSGSTTDFKDFTGAKTAVGGHNTGQYQIQGKLEGLSYYNRALNNEDIKGIYKGGKGNHINYKYDTLGRVTEKTIDTGIAEVTTKYNFEKGKNGNTTTRVSEIDNDGKKIAYTYDANGNIETIIDNGKKITYTYDELNQLIKERNEIEEKEISYTYDVGGNIVGKTETTFGGDSKTTTYKYEDSNWKDKLTNFNGKAITYDGIGNPLTYDGWNFQWEQGRKLSKLDGNGYNISYKYNASGIRTEKEVNGVVTKYHLEGANVTFETNGKYVIYYTYTVNGQLISMNLNGEEYYYVRNAQKDIIGLTDKAGKSVVEYSYDSWGKLLKIVDTSEKEVGKKNPYRYRGYRCDSETGLYYLNSRFYNPEWDRFINSDSLGGSTGELLSHNTFAYCSNNPIVRQDSNGYIWDTILDIGCAIYDFARFVMNPTWSNGVDLAWDVGAVFVPCVPGSYAKKAFKFASKAHGSGKSVKSSRILGSYKKLVSSKVKDAHHIIQDAAMRNIHGYKRRNAPAIQLKGPANKIGTPHYYATKVQRTAGGGTYGAERRIGYKTLRKAGLSIEEAKNAIRSADKYFMDELGLNLDSITRMPGNRGRR
ncbi:DNRLRE domain-containing protein [Clostridium botulinum]|uniref:DNRLRE domain-containing protein n=3 Tax=Clostridium botulinum TaxID=1491 RepID=UPI0002DEE7FA|nr:DNRLRE domain-containing protein [Clostridium botulinum]KLU74971.1 cell wall associated protein [Clostridium botulinum V891]KOA95104.1 cell wall associated protein [Clostridium botulinum]MCD3201818.1 DNRLRE domain-containing protein [Clostridium botulinum C/D]MCD3221373.1 DNRLRE domain-containing protein [Clostridium botulinum C/D]MCD3229965.1 DNRLRE domain-containing protein [Clostridium botulinum C/D]